MLVGCTCQDCGSQYRADLMVPDEAWKRITPKPEEPGAGLLCPTCIMHRLLDAGLWTVGFAYPQPRNTKGVTK